MDTRPTTASELLSLPDDGLRSELVRGELRQMSPASFWHGAVALRVAALLDAFVRTERLGVVVAAETGFLLATDPDTVLAPDVAFVAAARARAAPARGYFPGAPDLAVEVTSPGDSFAAVQDKALAWLAHGTAEVWIVDPRARRVTVYRGRADVAILGADDELRPGAVPGFAVRVADLFADG